MKFRFCAALLLAALSITSLTGCTTSAAARTPDHSGPTLSGHIRPVLPEQTAVPTVPTLPAPAAAPAADPASTPTAPAMITKEEAIAIALPDAGLSENQVTRLKAEFDYDDGRPTYDVEFRHDGWEYDYEIHAESGKILSRDKDRDN